VAQPKRFYGWLALVTLVGLGVRLAYVLVEKRDQPIGGDAYYYHWQARLLAEGKGFIAPLHYNVTGQELQAADHPPLYVLFLAAFSWLGLKSFLTHKVLGAFLGAASVWVMGLVGREAAGPRAGLLAAAVAALYANFWLHDGMVMSESMTILTVAAAVFAAYRFWRRPSLRHAAWFGVAGGLAALSHPDGALVLPLAGIPVVFAVRRFAWRDRLVATGVMAAAGAAVMAPWVAYNLARFERPVFLSTGLEITMAVSNCDETYRGAFRGFWYMPCASARTPPPGDFSEQAPYWRRLALDYMREHAREVPGVVAARIGRTWHVYRPGQQLHLDVLEGHELWVSKLALAQYAALMPLAVAGAVVLRRRRVPVAPFACLAVIVTIAVAITFGNTRYRAPAEVAIAGLAAVAVDAAVARLGARRRRAGTAGAAAPADAAGPLAPARG
jgi:4-amino-4-deoxy-L-arabinose transferase-like glycosyltransferase